VAEHKFSTQLEKWLSNNKPKTLRGAGDVFGSKSFAVLFVVLMVTPALPIPTGGITHVFEILTVILAVGYMTGRETIWIPKRYETRDLGFLSGTKVLPRLLKIIKPVESFARPRNSQAINSRPGKFVLGALIILFTIAAFLSPPFSGLDTLPALGVVILSLGILFEDALLVLFGTALGALGIGLIVVIGGAILKSFHWLS
jgi:hypothetical protein